MTVTNATTTANPTEMAGKPDRGTLQTYQASAGQVIMLSFDFNSNSSFISSTNDRVAATIKGLDQTGVVSGSAPGLTHATTPVGTMTWVDKHATPDWWYTSTYPKYTRGTTKSYDFYLDIAAGTPADYYDLAFQVGGGGEDWSAEQRFYLQVLPAALTGDADDNGVVDAADYVALKSNMGQGSGAMTANGNFDGDGDVDWNDLQLLQAHYGETIAGSETVPEPATLFVMMAAGLPALLKRRRRRS